MFSYDNKIHNHHMQLKCFPQNSARQTIEELEYEIEPKLNLIMDDDHFGNRTGVGLIERPHTGFSVTVKGSVQTGVNIYEEISLDDMKTRIFCYPSPYTQIGEELRKYHSELNINSEDGVYDKTLHIMRQLSEDMKYESGVTDIHTTAEEAMKQKSGVCQDYAHIMLALCRMEKIPVRYVVGMMQGEGASHAWVEALCKGYWYGFDPTNNLLVNDSYIKISHGRDYEDCIINKGFFLGATTQNQNVEVIVMER